MVGIFFFIPTNYSSLSLMVEFFTVLFKTFISIFTNVKMLYQP